MANRLKNTSFEDLFTAGEQPGSQYSYEVDRELQRRRELALQAVEAKMIEAAQAQIDGAASAAEAASAAVKSAEATMDTAFWTKMSAIAVAVSVAILAISTVLQVWKS